MKRDYNSSFQSGYGTNSFSKKEEEEGLKFYKHRPGALGGKPTTKRKSEPESKPTKPKPKPRKKPAGGMSRNERNLRRRQGRL